MMKNDNFEITQQLVKMREERNLTQVDMANLLGITQGQYSSVEGGAIRISREYLVKLYAEGWEVDELFGEKETQTQNVKFQNRLVEYETNQENRVLEYIYLAFSTFIENNQNCKAYGNELKLLYRLLNRGPDKTVLYEARKMMGKSQVYMADIIGVSTRTLRKYEKGYRFPDGELLGIINRKTNCRASLFLGLGSEAWNIVEYIWSNMDENIQIKY